MNENPLNPNFIDVIVKYENILENISKKLNECSQKLLALGNEIGVNLNPFKEILNTINLILTTTKNL